MLSTPLAYRVIWSLTYGRIAPNKTNIAMVASHTSIGLIETVQPNDIPMRFWSVL